uniref:Uncharacterized protein n=1 Tax=Neisseria meningitidis alpha275 TaxID=295996 RepID=C6SKA6_NEIME|nr:hypothetical protein predicted by Glimmer/Critica [Neisseria meningitidis alpha275]
MLDGKPRTPYFHASTKICRTSGRNRSAADSASHRFISLPSPCKGLSLFQTAYRADIQPQARMLLSAHAVLPHFVPQYGREFRHTARFDSVNISGR